MLAFSEFATKPFIRRAATTPIEKPAAVLSFFFGVNFLDNEHEADMRAGTPLNTMGSLWYQQSDDYDSLCRNSFTEAVRRAGTGKLSKIAGWNDSVDGIMSQILLCDQLSRNCFRGKDEAFQYDKMGEELTLRMVDEYNTSLDDNRKLVGEFYPPYLAFMVVPLMHTEKLENHEMGLQLIDKCQRTYKGDGNIDLVSIFEQQKGFLLEHKAVVEKFGRYPHRNAKLGRISTREEKAWLQDIERLPGWAKSQG